MNKPTKISKIGITPVRTIMKLDIHSTPKIDVEGLKESKKSPNPIRININPPIIFPLVFIKSQIHANILDMQ